MELNIWVEKYRPKKLKDMILKKEHYHIFKNMIDNKKLTGHLLFYGRAGIGKTTLAKILAHSITNDVLFINSSDERGIDTVRKKIKSFAQMKSIDDSIKIIILDELDNTTGDGFDALRGIIELYSKTTHIIATCNYIQKIPEPILSRFQSFEFFPLNKEIAIKYIKERVLVNEEITYEDSDLEKLYKVNNGDLRLMINSLQKSVLNKKLLLQREDVITKFLEILKTKDIEKLKLFLSERTVDYNSLYKFLFENIKNGKKLVDLAEYQYRHTFSVDAEINFTACVMKLWGF